MAEADETYRTVAESASASFTVQGSEFIGHIAPAESVEAAEAFVEQVTESYDNATHNVPAYRVRAGDSTLSSGMTREYSSDNGEPAGSAGKPALNVLQGEDLENVVCVLTRYYGGTTLGTGGLARAYGRATKEAIAAAGTIEQRPHERARVTVEYDDSGTVRGVLESDGIEFEAVYEERVTFAIRVSTSDSTSLYNRLRSATSGRARIE
ncbi:hypothetical protein BRC86_06605 [Halobacteriales archaeon QS_3_64_16]|nr:MAG: hypothetical protein BRC86_06605 [Halobacteriales archaeon QS_3_64_16]